MRTAYVDPIKGGVGGGRCLQCFKYSICTLPFAPPPTENIAGGLVIWRYWSDVSTAAELQGM
jgi:hypothetical protein